MEEKTVFEMDPVITPELTLEPVLEPAEETAAAELVPQVEPVECVLSAEEQKMVDEFAAKIDLTDSAVVLQYGASAQKKVADFSDSALDSVRTKDLGEVGKMIASLVGELKGFTITGEEKGFFGRIKKAANNVKALKVKYDKAEVNVDKISGCLEGHQIQLLKDIAMLDKMYDMNLVYHKELSMYILAGRKKLAEVRATMLPELIAKAEKSGLTEDSQAANDLAAMCDRFEKKLHDLDLTRMISLQMAPQIRLVQNNDMLMTEKIQSTIVNTIPLWKSQMVIALGLEHSREAMEAQHAVTEMTNELLKKNADALKMGTIETAKESERGVVDIETITHTNESLITTLDEVMRIQDEGRVKRAAAEQELTRIEGELKQKLLEIRK